MARIFPFAAGAVAAFATAQGTPNIQWRIADSYSIDSCRMVFDGARSRFVAQGALGGLPPLTVDSFTVEWDGHRWETKPTAITPPARAAFGLAYDMGRSRVVLFGGGSPSVGLVDDVWES